MIRRLRCWLRNYHRWMVPDLATIAGGANLMNVYAGECADCGAVEHRTAAKWQATKRFGGSTP